MGWGGVGWGGVGWGGVGWGGVGWGGVGWEGDHISINTNSPSVTVKMFINFEELLKFISCVTKFLPNKESRFKIPS